MEARGILKYYLTTIFFSYVSKPFGLLAFAFLYFCVSFESLHSRTTRHNLTLYRKGVQPHSSVLAIHI